MAKSNSKKSLGREIWEWCYTIVIALAIALTIKAFLFDIVVVDGSSMHPTLADGERLIVTKLGYKPENGDIVILDSTYKQRQDYYNGIAEAKGKDELNAFEKITTYFTLPDHLKTRFYVKRVIGMPGETVDIKNGVVLLNGSVLDEEYYDGTTAPTDSTVSYPVTVADNCVFVMGDNRYNSTDSRSSNLGQVPYEAVIGKAQLRIFPFNRLGILN